MRRKRTILIVDLTLTRLLTFLRKALKLVKNFSLRFSIAIPPASLRPPLHARIQRGGGGRGGGNCPSAPSVAVARIWDRHMDQSERLESPHGPIRARHRVTDEMPGTLPAAPLSSAGGGGGRLTRVPPLSPQAPERGSLTASVQQSVNWQPGRRPASLTAVSRRPP